VSLFADAANRSLERQAKCVILPNCGSAPGDASSRIIPDAQKGPSGPFARRLTHSDWDQSTSHRPVLGDRVRFPAGAPHPRVGLLVASHHRKRQPDALGSQLRMRPVF
jgi:hypothetical protein